MSTDSIEAAFDAHLAHQRDGHGHLPAGTVVTACCEPTLRALALWTLKEYVAALNRTPPDVDVDFAGEAGKICARIEALGR